MSKYPVVESDMVARCFACGSLLKNHRGSGYPAGSGARQGDCPGCGSRTWYDLKSDLGRTWRHGNEKSDCNQ